jgi:hypothetical protein
MGAPSYSYSMAPHRHVPVTLRAFSLFTLFPLMALPALGSESKLYDDSQTKHQRKI